MFVSCIYITGICPDFLLVGKSNERVFRLGCFNMLILRNDKVGGVYLIDWLVVLTSDTKFLKVDFALNSSRFLVMMMSDHFISN